ncbi:hypothetical protein MITS9509_03507 [Synechococcus sp. MIT S9509]|uniref:hypothetical protein n=1 Tax=Synechococcus sp. MIT S9509 TaxID=1801630 RepID=UPI0007BC6F30|nr:hypothetical protein [Synechococcus sp. MIT S9509]KZR86268.1 hypothetical protein MITS9509_03507 [Synechococcus sp. MIT S9509]
MAGAVPGTVVDKAINQRIRMHGWCWPRGTQATVARSLGVTPSRVQHRRLQLLLDHVKDFP